jgi:hypothetical protein
MCPCKLHPSRRNLWTQLRESDRRFPTPALLFVRAKCSRVTEFLAPYEIKSVDLPLMQQGWKIVERCCSSFRHKNQYVVVLGKKKVICQRTVFAFWFLFCWLCWNSQIKTSKTRRSMTTFVTSFFCVQLNKEAKSAIPEACRVQSSFLLHRFFENML